MKTAIATCQIDPSQLERVWCWPRRPPGWFGMTVTLHPWVFRRDGTGWNDLTSDQAQFTTELVADLRTRDAARIWRELHAQAEGKEPVLVSAPTRLGLIARRAIAEWFEETGHGLVEELPTAAPLLESIVGFDPWASEAA